MIKINLLPSRKTKRRSEPGQLEVALGTLALVAAGALVYFTVHAPKAKERDEMQAEADSLAKDNGVKKRGLADLPQRKAAVDAEEARTEAIGRLIGTTVNPDNILHELGEILTPGRLPTMTIEMSERVSEGPKGDPNRRFSLDWDPKHVWITSLSIRGSDFTLEGGAQSESDVPQLAKRMLASVYFGEVTSPLSQRFDDKLSGYSYYKFTISGKVVY